MSNEFLRRLRCNYMASDRISLLMPLPRSPDDVVEPGIARLPAEFPDSFLRACHQHGWIAGPAGVDFRWNRVTRDPPRRLNHLAHAESMAVAEVADQPGFGFQ